MKITYGISDLNIDVTEACLEKMKKDHYLIIPSNDNVRCNYFSDPLLGTLKSIFITVDGVTTEYDHTKKIFFDLNTNQVLDPVPDSVRLLDVDERLADIHKNLTLLHGSFRDEFPEQRMAVQYIHPTSKVLEIGGNIGRNSLIIASLLTNQLDMVVLETDPGIAYQLRQNRDQNRLDFHIENSALSIRKLIQKGWDTIVSDEVLPGYIPVSIISYDKLVKKYNNSIKLKRITLLDMYTRGSIDESNGELFYDGNPISVVYFRAGYTPDEKMQIANQKPIEIKIVILFSCLRLNCFLND